VPIADLLPDAHRCSIGRKIGRHGRLLMSFYRAVTLGLALLTIVQVADTNAQAVPVMGYVAAKNANPKRLEVFKKGLAELGYIEGKNIRIEYR
jgi:putative ABC transport system substrate-binding protein